MGVWVTAAFNQALPSLRICAYADDMSAPESLADKAWAIVYNPTKLDDVEAVKQQVAEVAAGLGWPEPTWHETNEDDPGASMAKAAVDEGARLVCAFGGDGTVRHVAGALRDTDVVLGLLPAGTGNLLARNLGLPVNDFEACLTIALTGDDHPIDVGLARMGDTDEDEPFVIAAGIGLDADIMAETDDDLKKKVGRLAYVAAGAKAIARRGFEAHVTVDGERRPPHHARMVMVCNSPSIGGGFDLAADGAVDDGEFATVLVSPKGIFGWAAVVADMITHHRKGHGQVQELSLIHI